MEKKKIIALLAFTMLAAASTAYATGTTTINPGGTYWGQKGTVQASVQMGKLSTNVGEIVAYDSVTYAATSKHLSGDKCFGAGSGDTRIYVMDCVKGVSLPTSPGTSDSNAFTATTWSSL